VSKIDPVFNRPGPKPKKYRSANVVAAVPPLTTINDTASDGGPPSILLLKRNITLKSRSEWELQHKCDPKQDACSQPSDSVEDVSSHAVPSPVNEDILNIKTDLYQLSSDGMVDFSNACTDGRESLVSEKKETKGSGS
jgi:hypothetical protein